MIVIGFHPSSPRTHHEDGRALLSLMAERFCSVGQVEIWEDRLGKPRTDKFPFSISHSASLVMCALFSTESSVIPLPIPEDGVLRIGAKTFFAIPTNECKEIGVDLEVITLDRTEERLMKLAERYFAAGEKEKICKDSLRRDFFNTWTRKESYLKLTGEGISAISRTDTSRLPKGILCHSFRVIHNSDSFSASLCYRGR